MNPAAPASSTPIAQLPLARLHRELGARMGPFAGFDMPIQYPAGLKAEHLHTRNAAGFFDVSHMGQLRLRARDGRLATLAQALERALPVDLDDWPSDLQRYTVLLNEAGGINDDLMLVFRQPAAEPPEVRAVVNASNRAADLAQLRAACPALLIEELDAALFALQGPHAERVLAAIDPRAAAPAFMQAFELSIDGASCFATRSGYTGEDGYEISVPRDAAERVARRLLADPAVQPVGLGARDTLRLEAGLPLHGNDISPAVSPVEAGLGFAIARSRRSGANKDGGFPGADRVLADFAQGPSKRLMAYVSNEGIPIRAHATVLDEAGHPVGEVTSGTLSPTLGKAIVLALVERTAIDSGARLRAVVRDKRPQLEPVKLPFVAKRYKR